MSRAFRLGVFIFVTMLILATGIFLIGRKRFLFSSTYRLTANFQNVAGLDNGAEVRAAGIHVGTVKEIDLPRQPSGEVTVVMDMESSTRNIIRTDSIASIKTEGLLGDKYVEVSFGSDKAEAVASGAAIRGESPTDVSQLATAAAAQAKEGAASFRDNMEALKRNFLLRGFFEKRGYYDASELTAHRISHLPTEHPVRKFDYDEARIFNKRDNAKLKNGKALDEAGKFLQENKFALVVVAADGKGTEDKGEDALLPEARAKVVRDYLTHNFKLDDDRIKTLGTGKTLTPRATGNIEILVYAEGSVLPPQNQTSGGS